LPERTYRTLIEELEMLEHAGETFDAAKVRAGDLTPVFFGSAVNNFGVQLLLDNFLEHAPAPQPRQSRAGLIGPEHPRFSGFIFKIQSNMNPKHRDQIAFVRVCSGRFTRDMQVTHTRTGKTLRLSSSHKVFARERETVDEAFPGDVIGLVGHDEFGIGDTLTEDAGIEYHEIPRFAPECFAFLHNPSTAHFKRFRAGLSHLLQEGVVQSFELPNAAQRVALLGAVGPLQFEVLQFRLETEYGAKSRLEPAAWSIIRWVDAGAAVSEDTLPGGCRLAVDAAGQTVALFTADWQLNLFVERNPKLALHRLPPPVPKE
jgi:peptide chain release factor 3